MYFASRKIPLCIHFNSITVLASNKAEKIKENIR
jgi:hypothetical protein